MRTFAEVNFRIRQEAANLRLWVRPPRIPYAHVIAPLAGLPNPATVVESLQYSAFSNEVRRISLEIVTHHIPLLEESVDVGSNIQWRRDYRSGIASGRNYCRRIPYLDVARVGDHKPIWELNRHQHLVLLAQAYRFTRQQPFLDEIERQLEGWLDDNPFMRGINWTSALEVSFRALSWLWVYHLLGDRLRDSVRARVLAGLYQHGRYIEANLSIYFSPNTHLLGEAVALHALGQLFPQFPGARTWASLGGDVVAQQIMLQVREDGSHFEQSSYYQIYALDMFVFHAVLARVTPEYRSRLRAMARYVDALMGPARVLPFLGDDDGGRFFHPYGSRDRFGRATLATCAILLDEPFRYDDEDVYEQAAWWLGTHRAQQTNARATGTTSSILFRNSGVAKMTSGDTHILMDCGPFGTGSAGHSHSDSLSIVVRLGTDDVLADAGTYTYVGDVSFRNWFRGSAAHNTVRIDQRNQATASGPFQWIDKPVVRIINWTTHSHHDFAQAVCCAFGIQHTRSVLLLKSERLKELTCDWLVLCDVLEGTPGAHIIEQFWHPGEDSVLTSSHHLRIGNKSHLLIPDRRGFEVENGWHSRVFGEKSQANIFVVREHASFPLTTWAALSLGDCPNEASIEEDRADDSQAVLHVGSHSIELTFSPGSEVPYKIRSVR
jgi:hypothetical protein